MKAVIYTKYGSPDVINVNEIEKPIPKENELLIKIHATTVNRTDCAMLRAKPFIMRFFTGLITPKKPTLGTDFSGIVKSVGKNVQNFKVGDRVFCFDDSGIKSQAEFITINENKPIVKIPNNISFTKAVACVEGFYYAHNFIKKVDIKKGHKILINGGTGSIGSAMIQLAKYYKANITATCRSEHIELVKSLGANKVIDYTKEDFTTLNEKFDFVFDAVGKSTFGKCKPLLVSGGTYISSELGPNGENIFYSILTPLIGGRKVIFPLPSNIKASLELSRKLIREGKFKAVIDKTYSLDEIAEAYRYVETGEKVGNVVVEIK